MDVCVIPGGKLSAEQLDTWRTLQHSNDSLVSPYFCPEFTQSVASVRSDVFVAFVRDAGRIAAVFPFQTDSKGDAGPAGGGLSDYHGVIAAPDFKFEPLELLAACKLRSWRFNHLLRDQFAFQPHHEQSWFSPQIDVRGGYQAYVEERQQAGSEQFRKCANLKRRMEREIGPLRFVLHSKVPSDLDQVLAWKSKQFSATGQADPFVSGPSRALLERIHQTQSEDFAGMLSLLYAGDRLLAGHFGMRSGRAWHYWFPSYDAEMGIYSPGVLLLLMMAEHAATTSFPVIDLGAGMALYKQRLMNASVPLASGVVEKVSWRSNCRRASQSLRRLISGSPLAEPLRKLVRGSTSKKRTT